MKCYHASATRPSFSDTFVYNGLGLRVGKADSTGTYSYLCDGATPASPVLTDGHAVYTPGLSENRGGAISYPAFDQIGNLWTQDGSGSSQFSYEDTTGFGSLTALGGTNASPFKFGGGNGCQTDADTGLVLMGHRYYDTRIGRFISQDPIGDGDNWYAYAGNDPVDNADPTGLDLGAGVPGAVQYSDGSYHYPPGVPEPQAGGAWFSDDGNGGVVEHSSSTIHTSSPTNSEDSIAMSGGEILKPIFDKVLDFLTRDYHPVVFGKVYCGELPCGTQEFSAGPFYRGGSDFTFKPGEIKIVNGKVQPTHGPSLNIDKAKVAKWGAHRVVNVPDGLKIQQRGVRDPGHYEVMPEEEMEPELFQQLLRAIESVPEP